MILKYDFLILKKYYIETIRFIINNFIFQIIHSYFCLLYTSDAADD